MLIHGFPLDRKVNYCRTICDIRPQKKETHRVCITVGGNKLAYDGTVSTPTAYFTTEKLHLNSFISTPDAKYLIVGVKNFYLNSQINNKDITRSPSTSSPKISLKSMAWLTINLMAVCTS